MGNRIRSRKEDSGPTQRGATVCVSVRASLCVPSKLQMRLTPCVLLQGTKSQNIGHTRMSLFISVSSEAYSNPRVFQHLCVCVCSSIVCAALICAIGSKFGPTLLPHLMHSGSYGMNISFFFFKSDAIFCFFSIQGFEPEWLYTGENFGKVLTTLLAFNFATQGKSLVAPPLIQTCPLWKGSIK